MATAHNDDRGLVGTLLDRLQSHFDERGEVLNRNWAFVGSAMADGSESIHADSGRVPDEDLTRVRDQVEAFTAAGLADRGSSFQEDVRNEAAYEFSRLVRAMLSKNGVPVDLD
jgi:hypothetical protein